MWQINEARAIVGWTSSQEGAGEAAAKRGAPVDSACSRRETTTISRLPPKIKIVGHYNRYNHGRVVLPNYQKESSMR